MQADVDAKALKFFSKLLCHLSFLHISDESWRGYVSNRQLLYFLSCKRYLFIIFYANDELKSKAVFSVIRNSASSLSL